MDFVSRSFNVIKIVNFHQKLQHAKNINVFIGKSTAPNYVLIPVTLGRVKLSYFILSFTLALINFRVLSSSPAQITELCVCENTECL